MDDLNIEPFFKMAGLSGTKTPHLLIQFGKTYKDEMKIYRQRDGELLATVDSHQSAMSWLKGYMADGEPVIIQRMIEN